MNRPTTTQGLAFAGLVSLVAAWVFAQGPAPDLGVADYDATGALAFPARAERWITVGTGIGGDYAEGPFDPANPGALTHVQMEPSAYEHFMETGRYADGTMFLLSFYRAQQAPQPELAGFVQDTLIQREIHVIDRARYGEGRAFFLYAAAEDSRADPVPPGSTCVECHLEHGGYDGTFSQFYPLLRGRLAETTE